MRCCAWASCFLADIKLRCLPPQKSIFTETAVHIPGHQIPYEEVFYRKTGHDRGGSQAGGIGATLLRPASSVRLQPGSRLQIGGDTFNPDKVPHLELVADRIVLPREAMGLGGCDIHGGDWIVPGLAGGDFFDGDQFVDWLGHREC